MAISRAKYALPAGLSGHWWLSTGDAPWVRHSGLIRHSGLSRTACDPPGGGSRSALAALPGSRRQAGSPWQVGRSLPSPPLTVPHGPSRSLTAPHGPPPPARRHFSESREISWILRFSDGESNPLRSPNSRPQSGHRQFAAQGLLHTEKYRSTFQHAVPYGRPGTLSRLSETKIRPAHNLPCNLYRKLSTFQYGAP
jgi:hypothetical protein